MTADTFFGNPPIVGLAPCVISRRWGDQSSWRGFGGAVVRGGERFVPNGPSRATFLSATRSWPECLAARISPTAWHLKAECFFVLSAGVMDLRDRRAYASPVQAGWGPEQSRSGDGSGACIPLRRGCGPSLRPYGGRRSSTSPLARISSGWAFWGLLQVLRFVLHHHVTGHLCTLAVELVAFFRALRPGPRLERSLAGFS